MIDHPRTREETILSYGACEPSGLYPATEKDCLAQMRLLERYPSIRLVLVGSPWPFFDERGVITNLRQGSPGAPEDYPDFARYRNALLAQLREVASHGATVVLFGPKAEPTYDVANCYARALRPATEDCRLPRAPMKRSAVRTMNLLEEAARTIPGVVLFDQWDILCGPQMCDLRTPDGAPLIRDNGHYSVLGSELAIDRFFTWADRQGVGLPFPPQDDNDKSAREP